MKCPDCNAEISPENINIQTDVAQCVKCKNIFKVSETLFSTDSKFNIDDAPKGAWISKAFDQTIIGATTRSAAAFFLVPFMLIWSGMSLGGIYGSQILSGTFNPFMSLFGLPFLIGSFIFWSITAMAIWGKVELTIDNLGGKIFTGVGKIGRSKEFAWADVSRITEGVSNLKYPGSKGGQIIIEGSKRISFGSGLNESRRYYLLRSLKKMQLQYAQKGRSQPIAAFGKRDLL